METARSTYSKCKHGFILALLFLIFINTSFSQYTVNFEGTGETKTAYASGTVSLSGINWDMTEALIGTDAADYKNGSRSARLRGYSSSSMTMQDNKTNGIGAISFSYWRYGTDGQVTWKVEYSTNNGSTWTQAGSNFSAPSNNNEQTFNATVNVSGEIRIRIIHVSGGNTSTNRRLNIDDIEITDYPPLLICLTEDFSAESLPIGWSSTGVSWTESSGTASFNANNGQLATLAINYPSSISFSLARTINATAKTIYVEVSTTNQSSGYTTLATYDHSNTTSGGTTSCNVDLSDYSENSSVYIRFRKESSTTSPWRLDNIEVNCVEPECDVPTIHTNSLASSNITTESADITWTKGNGTYSLIVAKAGSAVSENPDDETTYEAEEIFGNGSNLGSSNFVVYAGTDNTFTMSGLLGGTTYHLKAYTYNCDNGSELYYTAGTPATHSFTTPPTQATGLKVVCTDANSAVITWNPPSGNYDGVVIGMRQSTNVPPAISVNPSTLTANSTFTSGTSYGASPLSYVVYKGTGSSVTVTGLTEGQNYRVRAYAYKDNEWATAQHTTAITNLGVTVISNPQAAPMSGAVTLGWTNPSAGCFDEVIIVTHTSSISGTPSGTYTASSTDYTDSSNPSFPSGGKVVFNGIARPQTITGLTNNTEYFFKFFVRSGSGWSQGVEISETPADVTILEYGDLIILGINAQLENTEGLTSVGSSEGPDEITFALMQDFKPNSTIDFTDNGYERLYQGYWATTEGVIRIKRTGATISAGTVITLRGCNGTSSPQWGDHFNIYTGGSLDNSNWEISSINGATNINLTTSGNGDQLWIMQNGAWDKSEGTHKGTYSGKVLYGWTPSGWQADAGYNTTDKSTMYPGADCSNSNLNGLANKYKVKYSGPVSAASPRDWVLRVGDVDNWTGYVDNASYFSGGSFGNTIPISSNPYDGNYWIGSENTDWFNCKNWGFLRVPDENISVTIPETQAERNIVIQNADAKCLNMTIESSSRNITIQEAVTNFYVYGNLTIESGQSVTLDNGSLHLYGNLSNSGTITQNSGTFYVCGEGNQTITSAAGSETYKKIVVDKPYGGLTLEKTIETEELILQTGVVTTGSSRIYVNHNGTDKLSGHSNISYINGNLRRAVAATGSYDFPVGNATNYQKANVLLNSSSGISYIDASFHSIDVGELDISSLGLMVSGSLLQTVLNNGFWTITPNAVTSVDYDVTLSARAATNAGAIPAQHTVVKRSNSSSDWQLQGNHNNSHQSISGGTVNAKRTGLTAFSDFALAKHEENALPVELTEFYATISNAGVDIVWITTAEYNNDYFVVEKSENGTEFLPIQVVYGAGFSNQIIRYSTLDPLLPENISYYRLRQFDYDGNANLSRIISVNNADKYALYVHELSSQQGILSFSMANFENSNYYFYITDMQGRNIHSDMLFVQEGLSRISIPIGQLSRGIYSLTLLSESAKLTERFIISD